MSGWRLREKKRFKDKKYEPLPWAGMLNEIDSHFAHRSQTDPRKVAYTPDEEFGVNDKQLSCSAHHYLKKFYPDLRDEVREKLEILMVGEEEDDLEIKFLPSRFGNIEVNVNGTTIGLFALITRAENWCRTEYALNDAELLTIKRKYREMLPG